MADLLKFLNPSFRSFPPTDVRFWFKDDDGSIKEVKAHTLILAAASDVFNREFYGNLSSEHDIEIKDACQEVFQTMVEFVYNKKPSYKDADLGFLASLYYLADKYDIQDLRIEIIAAIPDHEVTKENVLEIANLAEENILHNPLSEALYEAAARFVKTSEVLDFFTDKNDDNALVIYKMLKRVNKLRGEICEYCLRTPCLDGKRLTRDNFTPGAKAYYQGLKEDVRILISKLANGNFSAQWDPHGEGMKSANFGFGESYIYLCK